MASIEKTLEQARKAEIKAQSALVRYEKKATESKAKELEAEVRRKQREIEAIESGRDGGILAAAVGVVGVGLGIGAGYIVQRRIEGNDWETKSWQGVPYAAWFLAVPTLAAVPLLGDRYSMIFLPVMAGGAVGGAYLGQAHGKFEE